MEPDAALGARFHVPPFLRRAEGPFPLVPGLPVRLGSPGACAFVDSSLLCSSTPSRRPAAFLGGSSAGTTLVLYYHTFFWARCSSLPAF